MPKDPAPTTSLAKKTDEDAYDAHEDHPYDAHDDHDGYDDHDDADGYEESGPAPVVEHTVEDDRFGALTVRLDSELGEVTVTGERVPRVELWRAEGTEGEDHIPVGTRDGARLTLTVDGEDAVIDPAKGRLTRRSYRVDVRYAERSWRLVPDSIPGSRLVRAGAYLGDFTSGGDGKVLVEWREDAEPEALDAALGYALAAAFGTGAQPLWMTAIEMVGDLLPG
ncbi:hypothetical protein [Streptomyces sp. MA5143a]|uniref:hypothetical protein n=1 Tax=Streptomyces sp. MA5143a TaxID=2083010 RepID=UPI000D2C5F39|nr:hypothetical protein SMA5143A_6792 [Streptomyces sp. MA5143a]